MEEGKTALKILKGTHTGKRPLGRPRLRWEYSIIMGKDVGINTRG
jgi:hypothetical protein